VRPRRQAPALLCGPSTSPLDVMPLACRPWLLSDPIDAPCADISFSWRHDGKLRVLMHFSLVNGGLPNDLEIVLSRAIALRWAEEAVYSIAQQRLDPVPKLERDPWRGWTYPLLVVEDSDWFKGYEGLSQFSDRQHFIFLALNDVVEVMASPIAETRWVPPHDV